MAAVRSSEEGGRVVTEQVDPRAALASAKRIVVKIGSRAITQDGAFQALADQVAELTRRGHTVVLVSSGGVAVGWR